MHAVYDVLRTTLGWFGVAVRPADGAVVTAQITDVVIEPADLAARLPAGWSLVGQDALATRFAREELERYAAGELTEFSVPLHQVGTPFQLAAWNALRTIPYGQTRSYSQQAVVTGRPSAVRAVGAANGRNRIAVIVPCHRVIGAGGALVGFAGGVHIKRRLLEHEHALTPGPTLGSQASAVAPGVGV